MPRKQFREVVIDDSTKTIEILSLSYDDTKLTNLVCEMQGAGMSVRCQCADLPHTPDDISDGFAEIGFRVEDACIAASRLSLNAASSSELIHDLSLGSNRNAMRCS